MAHTKISRFLALLAGGLGLCLTGCGGGGNAGSLPPSLARLPLVPGAHVLVQTRQCDRGSNAFCAVELVLADPRLRSSGDLVTHEGHLLKRDGWSDASGDFGAEHASDSPGHKLHVTYATALIDLTGVDETWIKRPRALTLTLARTVLAREPAMALTLQAGPA